MYTLVSYKFITCPDNGRKPRQTNKRTYKPTNVRYAIGSESKTK